MVALILNDTRRSAHPGCMLVMNQLLAGCRNAGIQVCGTLPLGRGFGRAVRKEILNCDAVIINGEGTMHHDSPGALALTEAGVFAHKQGKPVIFINSVWEQNLSANKLLSCASMIVTRESCSAEEIHRAGFDAEVVPDLVMGCPIKQLYPQYEVSPGPVVVLDDVRWEIALLLAQYAKLRGYSFLRMNSRPSLRSLVAMKRWCRIYMTGGPGSRFRLEKISMIRSASIVVTGRFHGACLAILAERPFVAIPSNTHKIQGLLKDAHLGDCAILLADSELERGAVKKLDETVSQLNATAQMPGELEKYTNACHQYSGRARRDIGRMFQSIAVLIRKGGQCQIKIGP